MTFPLFLAAPKYLPLLRQLTNRPEMCRHTQHYCPSPGEEASYPCFSSLSQSHVNCSKQVVCPFFVFNCLQESNPWQFHQHSMWGETNTSPSGSILKCQRHWIHPIICLYHLQGRSRLNPIHFIPLSPNSLIHGLLILTSIRLESFP